MNHFYGLESVPMLGHVYDFKRPNEFNKIAKRVGVCILQEKRWPNFLAIDNVGALNGNGGEKQIVQAINNMANGCDAAFQGTSDFQDKKDKEKEEL